MIKDKPCCDNCPHYAWEKKACGEDSGHGACFYDSPTITFDDKGVPKHATFIVEATHRCSNHPFIAYATNEIVKEGMTKARTNYAASWRAYIDELPFLLDILAGGGDKAVRKEDDHA